MSFFVTLEAKIYEFHGVLKTEFCKAFFLRGEWKVGIMSCYTPTCTGPLWVFSNLVDYSYVNNVPMQLMDVLKGDKLQVKKPMYCRVIKKTISTINMEFKLEPKSEIFDEKTAIVCIFHFRKA